MWLAQRQDHGENPRSTNRQDCRSARRSRHPSSCNPSVALVREIPPFLLTPEPLDEEAAAMKGFRWADPRIGTRHRLGGAPEFIQGDDVRSVMWEGNDLPCPARFDQRRFLPRGLRNDLRLRKFRLLRDEIDPAIVLVAATGAMRARCARYGLPRVARRPCARVSEPNPAVIERHCFATCAIRAGRPGRGKSRRAGLARKTKPPGMTRRSARGRA